MAVYVVEKVRAQHVCQRGDEESGALPADGAQEPAHSESRQEEDAAQPEPLHHPVGQAEALAQHVEGADRPEVSDVLVGDGAHSQFRLPHVWGAGQEADRVQV